MRFRTVIFASMLFLVTAFVIVTSVGVTVIVNRAAQRDVAATLERGTQAFEELQTLRQALLRSQSRVVAEEPRLKAVVSTVEIDHETVLGVAQELRQAIQTDLFVVTNAEGILLADVAEPEAVGFDLKKNSVITAALKDGQAYGVWRDDADLFEVQARRLSFGQTVVGVLVLGYRLDDRKAENAYKNSGASTLVVLDGKVVAASALEDQESFDREKMAAAVAPALQHERDSTDIEVGSGHYVATAAPYPNYAGEQKLQYVVMRSLDRARGPAQRLLRVLLGLLIGGVVVAGLLAAAIALRISRPLDNLVGFTRRVAEGDLEAQAVSAGPVELRTLTDSMNLMVRDLAKSRETLMSKERLENELRIAAHIQTSLLPAKIEVQGLEIAAIMVPATEVGGDYYDVVNVQDGAWIGIGDVAGHGLTSGLVMLMVQSVVSGITRLDPDLSPRDVVRALNRVIFDNVRNRLHQDEHVTLTLLRYTFDGNIVLAGAHEDIVVVRKSTGKGEIVQTPGTWVGALADVDRFTVETVCNLEPGDVMLLYTDGVTEAMSANNEQYGIDRLLECVERNHKLDIDGLRDAILGEVKAFAASQADDITIFALRYVG